MSSSTSFIGHQHDGAPQLHHKSAQSKLDHNKRIEHHANTDHLSIMVQSSSPPHFAAMLMMLLAGASVVPDGADAHIYRHPRGGNSYNAWPAAFVHHRGADYSGPWKSLFTPAPPRRGRGVLNDVFQELYSGVEQGACYDSCTAHSSHVRVAGRDPDRLRSLSFQIQR